MTLFFICYDDIKPFSYYYSSNKTVIQTLFSHSISALLILTLVIFPSIGVGIMRREVLYELVAICGDGVFSTLLSSGTTEMTNIRLK